MHKCKMLVNDLGDVKNRYWFDRAIYIDPAHYEEHKFGFVNIYYAKAQSPWLRYVYEGQNFDIDYTAISIKQQTVGDGFFKLPNFPNALLK
jgi:hypothetical protein